MAYKNKSKNKKHISELSTKGWRKDKATQKETSRKMDMLRNIGVPSSEMDSFMKMLDKK